MINQLTVSYQQMVDLADTLPEESFFARKNDKWSTAETIQHLYLSARSLPKILNGSRTLFDQWPHSGRSSRSYDKVGAAYTHTLQANDIKAPASLVARPEDMQLSKVDLLDRFISTHQALANSISGWSAEELDRYQLPHPALGLITVGEMIVFTAYHIDHHRAIEEKLL